jgi:DNA polymerase-1
VSDSSHELYLIDISSFIFRAYHAIRPLTNRHGTPLNAVYGVASMLAKLTQEMRVKHLAVVYDSKEPSFRKTEYAEYKANRSAPPDDLKPQFDLIENLISAMKIHSYRMPGVEADDLIGTLTKLWCESSSQHRVKIVSGDKDLMQLVNERVVLLDTLKNTEFGIEQVTEKFGIPPTQVRDYLALVGDSSDNIPGVPSIGPKSAADLLKEHGTLENILAAARAGKIAGKKGEVLKTHVEDAKLSQWLATLKQDCPVTITPEQVDYNFVLDPDCEALLKEFEFGSMIEKWKQRAQSSSGPSSELSASNTESESKVSKFGSQSLAATDIQVARFETVATQARWQEVLTHLRARGEFAVDLETTSLNPRQAEIVGISLCWGPDVAVYVPVGHVDPGSANSANTEIHGAVMDLFSSPLLPGQLPRDQVLSDLKPLIEDPRIKKIGQNLKYDFSVLVEKGFAPQGVGADTMLAAYLVEPEGRHGLDRLALQYLGYEMTPFEAVVGSGKNQITFDRVSIEVATRYSAEDAWAAWALWQVLQPMLVERGLMQIFAEVDLPLVLILLEMEKEGVSLDLDYLKKLSVEFAAELVAIEAKVAEFSKEFQNDPINLNSPKQLQKFLFEDLKLPAKHKTKTGYSTDASVLAELAPLHEVPKLLLEYREIAKLKGTYVDPLPELRDPKDLRVHPHFHQTVAATGRLSCTEPNLQNIPIRTERGIRIRRAFVPRAGHVLISADYSQIELRILAHMSADPDLVDSFQKDQDIHRRTAADIYGIAPEEVQDHQRAAAKAINFGLMYGKTAFGLAEELGISRKEAQATIDSYFARYRGVKNFLDSQIELARERGWTETMLGRKRSVPEITAKNPMLRQAAERIAMNTPIQGTAADLMKIAMIRLHHAIQDQRLLSRMTVQVHDEILVEAPVAEVEQVSKVIAQALEGAMKLSVPLRVNVSSGSNWMDL